MKFGNKNILKSKHSVIVLSVLVLLVAFFLSSQYQLTKKTSITKEDEPTPATSPTSQTQIDEEVDEINDGVFISEKYDFKFTYPKDIFIYQTKPFDKDNKFDVSWDISEEGYSNMGGDPEGAGISVAIDLSDLEKNSLMQQFELLYKTPVGQMNSRGNRILQKIEMKDGNRGVVFKYDLPKWRIYDTRPNFKAVWIKGEETVWLDLFYNSKSNEAKYKKIFFDIVKSFEFLD
jgi:hypothetical protein